MKILVSVKRVPDPNVRVRAMSDGSGIDLAGVKCDINPFDEIALEEAVRIRERLAGTEVVVVSVGSAACEEQLRKALAFGADRALLIEANDELDSSVVAKELEALVRGEQPDLVLMGKQATDDDRGQAAQILAARLRWPQATCASKIDIAHGWATVTRESDTGEETLRMPLPCVITSDLRLNEPRYISLPGILKARSKPLNRTSRLTTAAVGVTTLEVRPAPTRPPGRKVGSVDELLAALRDRGYSL